MTILADAIIEAGAREICRQFNIDDGYRDGLALQKSIDDGMWKNHENQARYAVIAALRKLIELGPSADMVVAAYNCERNGGSLPDCLAAYLSQLKIEIEGTKS